MNFRGGGCDKIEKMNQGRICWTNAVTELPTAGSNPESPIQILMNLYLWIGNLRFEPGEGSSATQLIFIKFRLRFNRSREVVNLRRIIWTTYFQHNPTHKILN